MDLLLGSAVLAIVVPIGAVAAPMPAVGTDPAWLQAVGTGGVALNGSAAATADATVTLTIPAPSTTDGLIRLSNDGGTTWVEMSWTTATAWSLIDPAAGGTDTDGAKTVTVQGGDGAGPWYAIGSASILLDRTGPVITSIGWPGSGGPGETYSLTSIDAGVGTARSEVSLDGVHWQSLDPPIDDIYLNRFDYRDGTIGGSWTLGERTVYGRVIDKLGNITMAPTTTVIVTSLRPANDDAPPADFELPLPAITNHPFTIAPHFDPGFTVPTGATCQWRLKWGDAKARLLMHYDPTYGEVLFTVAPRNGVCQPWTFTLPYSSTLEYSWTFSINPTGDSVIYYTEPLEGSFRAEKDGTYRGISTSNLPLYYILPDHDLVGLDGTVTYRLYAVGGAPNRDGSWVCRSLNDYNNYQARYGGSAFTCRITSSGPWLAMWAKETTHYRWLVGYDPYGDRSRPVMRSLRATPDLGRALGTTLVVHLTWGATDKGTGVRRYTLQSSKNGGAWRTITLSPALTTSLDRTLGVGDSYRFRVRAVDRAGNVSDWRYTPTFRPRRYDDATSAATWSSGWTTGAYSGALGGKVHIASTAGRAVTLKFTGLAIGVVAPRGPGSGWARVYVDGVLKRTINLYAASTVAPAVVWSFGWQSAGAHSVRIVSLGTTGHPEVAIDGFAVLR